MLLKKSTQVISPHSLSDDKCTIFEFISTLPKIANASRTILLVAKDTHSEIGSIELSG